MDKIQILGSGFAIAQQKITNFDLEKMVDTSDEWIYQRTGIKSRYITKDENTSDLGYKAALQAIEDSGIKKEKIEAIICATMTPDSLTPSTACRIQAKLGLNDCKIFAIDVNAACSGFIYALQMACTLVNRFKRILIIGGETLSKIVDWQDRSTCVLFGDGAGAMIIEKGDHEVYHYANSRGDLDGVLYVDPLPLVQDHTKQYLHMQGTEVFRFATSVMKEAIDEVLKESGLTMDDIDLVIPHQANARIIQYVAKKMKCEISKFYMCLDEFGNTSSASIPITYAKAKPKGNVILVGFGAGLTYGATLIRGRK